MKVTKTADDKGKSPPKGKKQLKQAQTPSEKAKSTAEPQVTSSKSKGDFTVEEKKKKREIIEEDHHKVDIPPEVSDEEKKALEQTGEDATSGW